MRRQWQCHPPHSTATKSPQRTSSTVHSVLSTYMSLSLIIVCVSFTMSCSRSGMPSPVMALVGTTLTYLRGSAWQTRDVWKVEILLVFGVWLSAGQT